MKDSLKKNRSDKKLFVLLPKRYFSRRSTINWGTGGEEQPEGVEEGGGGEMESLKNLFLLKEKN